MKNDNYLEKHRNGTGDHLPPESVISLGRNMQKQKTPRQ